MTLNEFKTAVEDKAKYAGIPAAATLALALAPTVALADGETTVTSAVTGMASTVATDGQAMLVAILPVLAPLIAAGIVVVLGLRFVKKVSNKAG